jgi:hypothetical protein
VALVLLEFLQFFIMVPLAILAWRGIGAAWASRNPSNNFTSVIVPAIT